MPLTVAQRIKFKEEMKRQMERNHLGRELSKKEEEKQEALIQKELEEFNKWL